MPSWTHGGADAALKACPPPHDDPHPEVWRRGRQGRSGQWGQVLKRSRGAGPAWRWPGRWGRTAEGQRRRGHREGCLRGVHATAPGPSLARWARVPGDGPVARRGGRGWAERQGVAQAPGLRRAVEGRERGQYQGRRQQLRAPGRGATQRRRKRAWRRARGSWAPSR